VPAKQNMHVVININGWIPTRTKSDPDDGFVTPWAGLEGSDSYALVWEGEKLHAFASAISAFLGEQLLSHGATTVIKHTVFAALAAAVAVPALLMTAASVIDNPWGVCRNAAKVAGIELAHALLDRAQGARPVTLVGTSLGALVIYEALTHMVTRKHHMGIVQHVYLFGAPVPGDAEAWKPLTPLVAGLLPSMRACTLTCTSPGTASCIASCTSSCASP
jgi:hypothetical protein